MFLFSEVEMILKKGTLKLINIIIIDDFYILKNMFTYHITQTIPVPPSSLISFLFKYVLIFGYLW